MIFRSIVVLVIVLFYSACSQAESSKPLYPKVLPGDPILDASKIRSHTIGYKKIGSSMDYEMALLSEADQPTYELKIYFNKNPDTKPDTIYFDAQTLAYVGRRLEMKDYTIDVKVTDGHFTGSLLPTKNSSYKPVTYDKKYPHGAFEPAVINYFIAALPLKIGFKASLPVFDLNNGSQLFWSNIQVVSEEMVEYQGEKVKAWKVESDGIKKKTIWISEKYPFALKMKTKGSPGTWMTKH